MFRERKAGEKIPTESSFQLEAIGIPYLHRVCGQMVLLQCKVPTTATSKYVIWMARKASHLDNYILNLGEGKQALQHSGDGRWNMITETC
jgi:hypothetical protein